MFLISELLIDLMEILNNYNMTKDVHIYEHLDTHIYIKLYIQYYAYNIIHLSSIIGFF